MVEPSLEDIFPGLRGQSYQITSPKDQRYNCIAYAAGDTRNWWWPSEFEEDFWPAGVAREETIAAFRDAFATLGYAVCNEDGLEAGYDKVAIFAGRCAQARRQAVAHWSLDKQARSNGRHRTCAARPDRNGIRVGCVGHEAAERREMSGRWPSRHTYQRDSGKWTHDCNNCPVYFRNCVAM